MHATSRIEGPAPRRAPTPPLGAGGEPLRVVARKSGRLAGAAAPGTAAVGALAQPAGPVIVAPTSAGDPLAPGLRQGPPYVLAQFDPADYVLHRPRLGDGTVDTVTAAVSLAAGRAVARGLAPVVLGGDHTVALGGVTGVRRGLQGRRAAPVPLFLLWLDAHPDVNTAETSPSGHLHGMVLAGLLGAGPLAVTDPLPPQRVVLAGARAIDPGEAAFLEARPQLERWDVSRLRGRGWVAPLGRLLERVRRAGAACTSASTWTCSTPRWPREWPSRRPAGPWPIRCWTSCVGYGPVASWPGRTWWSCTRRVIGSARRRAWPLEPSPLSAGRRPGGMCCAAQAPPDSARPLVTRRRLRRVRSPPGVACGSISHSPPPRRTIGGHTRTRRRDGKEGQTMTLGPTGRTRRDVLRVGVLVGIAGVRGGRRRVRGAGGRGAGGLLGPGEAARHGGLGLQHRPGRPALLRALRQVVRGSPPGDQGGPGAAPRRRVVRGEDDHHVRRGHLPRPLPPPLHPGAGVLGQGPAGPLRPLPQGRAGPHGGLHPGGDGALQDQGADLGLAPRQRHGGDVLQPGPVLRDGGQGAGRHLAVGHRVPRSGEARDGPEQEAVRDRLPQRDLHRRPAPGDPAHLGGGLVRPGDEGIQDQLPRGGGGAAVHGRPAPEAPRGPPAQRDPHRRPVPQRLGGDHQSVAGVRAGSRSWPTSPSTGT